MIHPETQLAHINEKIGFGVVAKTLIPAGTVTWVKDPLDSEFSPNHFEALSPVLKDKLDRYVFRTPHSSLILCWDIARYMNHSCNPTCIGTENGFEVAIRNINPGEELTVDYASLYPDQNDSFQCYCGDRSCRGFIQPEDHYKFQPVWKERLESVTGLIHSVPQPLSALFPESLKGNPASVADLTGLKKPA